MSDRRPEQRRAHFRLLYPEHERPKIETSGHQHEVIEIAEGGIRIVVNRSATMQLGEPFDGDICFHDARTESVAGEVLRLEGSLAVIKLTTGLSLHRVMVEQSYIQKKYPMFIANSQKKRP